jgi:signal transduction histidine kinase
VQIWTKLTLGFTLTAITIVGAYGASQLVDERQDLRRAADAELQLIGAAVQVALADSLGDQRLADAREMLNVVRRRGPSVNVLFLDPAGVLTVGSWSNPEEEDAVRRLVLDAQGASRSLVSFEGPGGLSHAVGAFPIRADDGSNLGTVALIRSLEALREDLASETRATVLSLLTIVGAFAGAGWLLALVYVRRPLLALVEALRAVRSGSVAARVPFRRPDEIGLAIAEFNALVDDLAEARTRLTMETEARAAMEANLQRADKLVTIGQLSAGLAHEIGSPLQILNGRARALAARADLHPDVRRTTDILVKESDRIARIVEHLLMFSRRSSSRVGEAHLREPVRDIIDLFSTEASRHQVRLEFDCDDRVPLATVDVDQVQQVVMNLLRNAVRAAGRGGFVRVELRAASMTDGSGGTRPAVLLVVEDTGDGISPEFVPRLFEPFFTTHAEAGGTGLGLAVVKSIVDSFGGVIAVTTRAGEGARFSIHFPAHAPALAGSAIG